MKKFELFGAGAALASAATLAAGCAGEKPAQTVQPLAPVSASEIDNYGTLIHPGESRFIPVITKSGDPALYDQLVKGLPLINHHNRHGAYDPMAPTISFTPQRLDSHVDSGSHGDSIENDAACDTLNIADGQAADIGAVALSDGQGDAPLVVWPENINGQVSDSIYLCFFEGREPADGTILVEDN